MIQHVGTPPRKALWSLASLGALSVTLGVVGYPIVTNQSLARGVQPVDLVNYAYAAFASIVAGLSALSLAVSAIISRWPTSATSSSASHTAGVLARVLSSRKYSMAGLISAVAYGVSYALASGIIVFQSSPNFSELYHVSVPSLAVATCCGPVGQTPQMAMYLTQHVGILLVPINIVFLFTLSWLIGLNASLAAYILRHRVWSTGPLNGLGAFAGLFTSCPTCAGLAILTLLGGTGTLSTTLFLGPLQTLSVGLSLPVLLVAMILSARSVRSLEAGDCARSSRLKLCSSCMDGLIDQQ